MTVRVTDREVETFVAGGNTFRVLDDGTSTDGRIGIVEAELPPGWPGPPQHVHREHDETFYVLEGRVRYASGDVEFIAEPGDLVTVPAGDPHTFGNADADKRARILGSVSPATYIEFFRRMATLPVGPDGRIDRDVVLKLMSDFASHPYPED